MDNDKVDEEKTSLHENNIVTIEDAGPCKKKIAIEVPEEAIKESLDEQYKDLRKEAEIPRAQVGKG